MDTGSQGSIKLVCLPYAGGSSSTYLSWKKWLDPRIELRPIELAGRRSRQAEPLYADVAEAVDDIFNRIRREISDSAYALLGHSMGTMLAYEVLRKIQKEDLPEPIHAFFSGRFPPFIDKERTALNELGDDDFIRALSQFGSASDELFKNREAVALFLPVLRNDYKLVETYSHIGDRLTLACNITVFHGKCDPHVVGEEARRWSECTSGTCSFREFDDGHFFINTQRERIASIINTTLLMT